MKYLSLLGTMHTHVHIPVRSALSNYITAIWETTAPGISQEVILPQGIVEMVFNLSAPMQGILPYKNARVVAPDYFLQGWNSHIVNVYYTGQQHLFGIRLQPYMVKLLLGILPSESKDTLIDLALIKPGFRNLWHRLNEAPGFTERVAIIETAFPVLTQSTCTRTQYFCDLFSSAGEHPFHSIDELSKQICYSSRQLNRKAQALFGVSAEELVIHKKFRTAIEIMHGISSHSPVLLTRRASTIRPISAASLRILPDLLQNNTWRKKANCLFIFSPESPPVDKHVRFMQFSAPPCLQLCIDKTQYHVQKNS